MFWNSINLSFTDFRKVNETPFASHEFNIEMLNTKIMQLFGQGDRPILTSLPAMGGSSSYRIQPFSKTLPEYQRFIL